MGIIEREIRDWIIEAEDLGKIGQILENSTNDIQRKKLSMYITKEVLAQCQEIIGMADDLQKKADKLMEYVETEKEKLQKIKQYPR